MKDWTARTVPQPSDFNTYIRDAFNFLTHPPTLRVSQNAVQSIPAGTWTVLTMGNVIEDGYSGWRTAAGNHYVAQAPGWYAITLFGSAAIAATNMGRVGLQYQINGNVIGPFEFNQSEAGQNPWSWDAYDETYLEGGDSVWPMIFHSASGSVNTSLQFPSAFEVTWRSK
ncbi:hypothetical protein EAS64_33930 [Trebonia kvetii]|uniref:C1q domain-containing protein n=1 Tax=Trebonia kvetii TaxID=2480626 RepID=A0A6P2BS84_9ACTN|nr:hypothetical protein [Trebonia kvetii]TVZ01281.1 hypothetical protein EAS64_33930 [Trebonia kvetii]